MVYSEAQGLIEELQGILFGSVLKCFQSRDRLVILQGEGEGGGVQCFHKLARLLNTLQFAAQATSHLIK